MGKILILICMACLMAALHSCNDITAKENKSDNSQLVPVKFYTLPVSVSQKQVDGKMVPDTITAVRVLFSKTDTAFVTFYETFIQESTGKKVQVPKPMPYLPDSTKSVSLKEAFRMCGHWGEDVVNQILDEKVTK